jgi:membrane protease YdiL (CAAX protease family)
MSKIYDQSHYDLDFAVKQLPYSQFLFLLLQVSSCLIVPIYEKIIFRGIIQNYLVKKCVSYWGVGVVMSSLIFALIHYRLGYGLTNLYLIPPIFVSSLFIGYLYQKTQSLSSCIAFHILHNVISTIALLSKGQVF